MKLKLKKYNTATSFTFLVIATLSLLLTIEPGLAHGPKGHSGMEFNALQAVKKGITLYDRLLESGKLSEPWETGLADIQVFKRKSGHKNEFVVKFSRHQGDPQSVFIFFTEDGKYSGSNFSGK